MYNNANKLMQPSIASSSLKDDCINNITRQMAVIPYKLVSQPNDKSQH